jgi:hypothetical protein
MSVAGVTHDARFIRAGKARVEWVDHGEKPADKRMVLKRDPFNEYDEFAIEVHWDGIGQIGFVPGVIARIIAPFMDRGVKVFSSVRHFGDFMANEEDGDKLVTFVRVGIAVEMKRSNRVRVAIMKERGERGQRWRLLVR